MSFEQDKEETPVLFRKVPGEKKYAEDGVTAVFPCEAGDPLGHQMTCYAHIGQHSACDFGWYYRTKQAKPEEYADLKRELEGAPYGYRLKIYKRIQPWMRDKLRGSK